MSPVMMHRHRLVLDLGGHAARARVYAESGEVICHAERPIATQYVDNAVEQDPEEVLSALQQCVADVAIQLGEACGTLVNAGLAVQRSSIVCWDRESGRPLSPVISWQDRRGARFLLECGLNPESVARITGLRLSPHYGAGKLRWCRDHLADVAEALREGRLGWGPLGSFLLYRLLDERPYVVDATLAQRTLLWSRHTRDWAPELVDAFGIDSRSLPAVVPNLHAYGSLPVGNVRVPLQVCIGDQNAVPWAAGWPAPGTACINVGTGAFLLRRLDAEVLSPNGLLETLLWDADRKAQYALEGTVNGAGSALDWLSARWQRSIPWQELDRLLDPGRDATAGLFLNGIGGLGSPWWVPDWRSYFVDADDFPGQLRSVLESIAFLLRVNCDAADAAVGIMRRVVLSGGLSRSDGFCQLLADVLESPVTALQPHDATARGLWQCLRGPLESMSAKEEVPGRRFEPRPRYRVQQRREHWLRYMPPASVLPHLPD